MEENCVENRYDRGVTVGVFCKCKYFTLIKNSHLRNKIWSLKIYQIINNQLKCNNQTVHKSIKKII